MGKVRIPRMFQDGKGARLKSWLNVCSLGARKPLSEEETA